MAFQTYTLDFGAWLVSQAVTVTAEVPGPALPPDSICQPAGMQLGLHLAQKNTPFSSKLDSLSCYSLIWHAGNKLLKRPFPPNVFTGLFLPSEKRWWCCVIVVVVFFFLLEGWQFMSN